MTTKPQVPNNFEDTRKRPFAKKEMAAELRKLLLIEAARIDLMRGTTATQAFIGFKYRGDEYEANYPLSDLERINLGHFEIAGNFDRAYDYAFQCGNWMSFKEITEQRLRSVTQGIPKLSPEGDENPFYLEDSKCRHVQEMASARYNLTHYEAPVNIRELSLLANMSEAAVRNSLSIENIKTEGKPSKVGYDDALRWLQGRRGFIPNRHEQRPEETAVQKTLRIFEDAEFSRALHFAVQEEGLLSDGKTVAEAIVKVSGVDPEFAQLLSEGRPILDLGQLCIVGQSLNLWPPKFVAIAVEKSLAENGTVFKLHQSPN